MLDGISNNVSAFNINTICKLPFLDNLALNGIWNATTLVHLWPNDTSKQFLLTRGLGIASTAHIGRAIVLESLKLREVDHQGTVRRFLKSESWSGALRQRYRALATPETCSRAAMLLDCDEVAEWVPASSTPACSASNLMRKIDRHAVEVSGRGHPMKHKAEIVLLLFGADSVRPAPEEAQGAAINAEPVEWQMRNPSELAKSKAGRLF